VVPLFDPRLISPTGPFFRFLGVASRSPFARPAVLELLEEAFHSSQAGHCLQSPGSPPDLSSLGKCWEITWNHHFQAISRTSSPDLPGKDGVAFHRPSHRSGHVLGFKGPLGQGLGVFHRRMVPSGRVPWLLWTFGELMLSNIWWNSVKLWYQLNNTCFPFFDPEHALIRSHVGGQKLVGGWKFKIVVLMSNSLPGMILWSPMTVETSVPSLYLSISCNTIIIYHYISNLSESISLVACQKDDLIPKWPDLLL
jgi:hypothetical protein